MAARRLIALIKNEIDPDDFDESESLEAFYKNLNETDKRVVDRTFYLLCGMSLRTLIIAKEICHI